MNDTFAILRGGTDQPWGVAVTCGAGINCVAVAPDGATARYLSHGTLTGDWGGGLGLGHAVMWHAMRGWDGRGPATALGAAVAAHFGLASVRDVAVAMHRGELGEADLIKLSAVLFAVAAERRRGGAVPGEQAGGGDPADGGRRDAAARHGARPASPWCSAAASSSPATRCCSARSTASSRRPHPAPSRACSTCRRSRAPRCSGWTTSPRPPPPGSGSASSYRLNHATA